MLIELQHDKRIQKKVSQKEKLLDMEKKIEQEDDFLDKEFAGELELTDIIQNVNRRRFN